ncbi:unnamed protein product [Didymodactylos carnosus]|uniref:Metallo-beta-lactamase domain-containing protein n=1 Tax=Didymodactylos carnosus TaxID=1234261 RepID=A0A814KYF9_9BILA|nr:unnamed protein product [Didymodactylos carnosus]CAF3826442.1 unnamed protein product [Didymodactylos carnosus]
MIQLVLRLILTLILFEYPLKTLSTDPFVCPTSAYQTFNYSVNWFSGSLNCFSAGAQVPDIQVYALNNHTYILRENKCINYEAPFMYVLFSNTTVLLIDSGATIPSSSFPIQKHVETLITQWCVKNGKQRVDLELMVAHTHAHTDHIAGDQQFKGQPHTTVAGTSVKEVQEFFDLTNWPYTTGTFNLDQNRILGIIPIPGHERSSIAFYDCATGILFTGDSLYPGRLYISNFTENVESIARLADFAKTGDQRNVNVTLILGAHIEMTSRKQIDYPTGSTNQPSEHALPLNIQHLFQLNSELKQQAADGLTKRHTAYLDDFIISPKPSELPSLPPSGRISSHGMILLPLSEPSTVWLSHVPMFDMPHDYQIVLTAHITSSTIEPPPLPTNTSLLGTLWTIVPDRWSLNKFINGNITIFDAQLFKGNSELSGIYLCNITLNVIQLLTISHLNSTEIEPYQSLRYFSYSQLSSNNFIIHLYLLHQIRITPDFDSVVHVVIDISTDCTSGASTNQTLLYEIVTNPNIEWAFPGRENKLKNRLTSSDDHARAQLLGDPYSTVCTMKIIEELSCLIGPGFFTDCETLD